MSSKSVAENSLTRDMIILIARMFGNEESINTIISSNPISDGVFGEQLSEQLLRDGTSLIRVSYFQFILTNIDFLNNTLKQCHVKNNLFCLHPGIFLKC